MATLFASDGSGGDDDDDYKRLYGVNSPRDTTIQLLISLFIGVTAFLTFCVLRPRWKGLYAARKKQKNEATILPDLPNSFFGWIMPLWRITDQQILASAGLDAYVFLAFFKMAMKFLIVTLFFSLIIVKPVHDAYPEKKTKDPDEHDPELRRFFTSSPHSSNSTLPLVPPFADFKTDYLWMYVILAYLYSFLAIWLVISETRKVISVRQEFLGSRTTVTDRTLRLSGIPHHLRDEQKIKEFVESLDIGKVEAVTLCRDWKELDDAMDARMNVLRKLEEAYTVYLANRRGRRGLPVPSPHPVDDATNHTTESNDETPEMADDLNPELAVPKDSARPIITLRHSILSLRGKRVDAIDHYETELRKTDELITTLRAQEFEPTPLAFVTMDSVAACQMAIQAVLDPSPLQLLANQCPEPSDVIWRNTYMSRQTRMLRSWSVSALIVFLTIIWAAYLTPVAGLLNVEPISRIFPHLGDILDQHKNLKSLISTQLPTLAATLLMALVPYLYYWLSWRQGQISRGDIELSSISKNFFFTFFNFFMVFTILGTFSNFYEFFQKFGDTLRNIQNAAQVLAYSLQGMVRFYVNFIILQGLALFPLRLLEVGSVSLYPIYRVGAKTPRDYAELVQPPVFIYGFYLPTAMLIFIICASYSVLRESWQVLIAGLAYFMLGHFVYKYQLLYAMDHRQQATGRAWGMVCDRVFIALVFFQLTTAGQLVGKRAFARSVLIVPLVIATIWISILYTKTYKPLLKFIALSSVKRGEQYFDDPAASAVSSGYSSPPDPRSALERNVWADPDPTLEAASRIGRRNGTRTPVRYVNPSLTATLHGVWISDRGPDGSLSGLSSREPGGAVGGAGRGVGDV